MKIANQLFDRSNLNATKKDTKLTVDKQATGGTQTSIPKKVMSLYENTISRIIEIRNIQCCS